MEWPCRSACFRRFNSCGSEAPIQTGAHVAVDAGGNQPAGKAGSAADDRCGGRRRGQKRSGGARSGGLALRAVPVAAGVVADASVRAVLAAFDMATQRRRSAALDCRHDLKLTQAHMAGMGHTPSRPAVAEDVRHLDRRP